MTRRLIEEWLPIAQIGIESLRERTPMTPFPAPNRLHVWWARRPLVASRAAIIASLLPADADRDRFLRLLGIHGDPVATRRRIDAARRKGERFEGEAYTYSRAFTYLPTREDLEWARDGRASLGLADVAVLDPTAGGGAVPFESLRLALTTYGNDLNPVANIIERATLGFPWEFGSALKPEFDRLAESFVSRREELLRPFFPPEPDENSIATNFIWARTVRCPHCEGVIPLSPNWRLAPDGTGVRLRPQGRSGSGDRGRHVEFEIVSKTTEHSAGTVSGGDATCPFEDCRRLVPADHIQSEAQAGRMGEQLYAVVSKRRIETRTKAGKRGKDKWERQYRAPRLADEVSQQVASFLTARMPEWEALDIVPSERIPEGHKTGTGEGDGTDLPLKRGETHWIHMFSPRQLLGHGAAVEVFRRLVEEEKAAGRWSELTAAAFCYLSFSLDKLRDYNSRMSRWHVNRELMVNTFDRHDFAFKWSYAEMSPLVVGVGYDWAIEQTAKCISAFHYTQLHLSSASL